MSDLESSLLYPGEDGSYEFVHDTLRDFFLAKALQRRISDNDPTPFQKYLIPGNILSLLAGMSIDANVLHDWIIGTRELRGTYQGGNAISILARAHVLKNEDFSGTDIHNADLSDMVLDDVVLRNCNLRNVNFDFTYLWRVDSEEADTKGMTNKSPFGGRIVDVKDGKVSVCLSEEHTEKYFLIYDYLERKETFRLDIGRFQIPVNMSTKPHIHTDGQSIFFPVQYGIESYVCCYSITSDKVIWRTRLHDNAEQIKISSVDGGRIIVGYTVTEDRDKCESFYPYTTLFVDVFDKEVGHKFSSTAVVENSRKVEFSTFDGYGSNVFLLSTVHRHPVDEDNNPTYCSSKILSVKPDGPLECLSSDGNHYEHSIYRAQEQDILGFDDLHRPYIIDLKTGISELMCKLGSSWRSEITYSSEHQKLVTTEPFGPEEYGSPNSEHIGVYDFLTQERSTINLIHPVYGKVFLASNNAIVYATRKGIVIGEMEFGQPRINVKELVYLE